MLLLEYKKNMEPYKKTRLKNIPKKHSILHNNSPDKTIDSRNLHTKTLSFPKKNIHNKAKKNPKLYNPKLNELELTPQAKKYIKAILFPFAVFPYILQKTSIAFNKLLTATTTFLIFSLLNCFTSFSFGFLGAKLPLLSICLIGSILGAKNLVNSIKKIILSVPEGIYACSLNVSCEKCSIFDFICGIDRHKKSFFKSFFKKFSF